MDQVSLLIWILGGLSIIAIWTIILVSLARKRKSRYLPDVNPGDGEWL